MMAIKPETIRAIGSATVGALGGGMVLLDSHYMGKRKSTEVAQQGYAKALIRNQIGNSKMDYPSPVYNGISKELKKVYPHKLTKAFYAIKGYFQGVGESIAHNVPLLTFSALAIAASKNKVFSTIGMVGAGLSALCGIIEHSTGLFKKKDYLD